MGKRLSKIYTRTGDGGTTGLGDGSRVPKDALRVQAMGDIDETNALMGVVIARLKCSGLDTTPVEPVQHRLFDLGGEISIPGMKIIKAAHVSALEEALDQMNAELDPLENFILPGGSETLGLIHLARSVCRRAERSLVSLDLEETEKVKKDEKEEQAINPHGLAYLNRLSDTLFVLARWVARQEKTEEVLWQQD